MKDGIREISIYDQLGPLTRAACRESPRDVSVRVMVNEWRHEVGMMLDPKGMIGRPLKDQDIDAELAEFVQQKIRSVFGKLSPLVKRSLPTRGKSGKDWPSRRTTRWPTPLRSLPQV